MIVWPGLRRSVSAIQRLFNGAAFALPLTHTAVPTRGSITPTFTRATTETGQKWDEAGYLDFTALAGEIVFKGARRVRNLVVTTSEDFSNAVFTRIAITVSGYEITETTANSTHEIFYGAISTVGAGKTLIVSAKLKPISGGTWVALQERTGGAGAYFNLSGAGFVGATVVGSASNKTITLGNDGYYTISLTCTSSANANIGFYFANGDGVVSYAGSTGRTIDLRYFQLEDVTGQTTQAASEYVSVGALIHNSQDPNFLSLPGTAGHYASTPDSVANSITGDITLVFYGAMSDWTPAAASMLTAKWVEVGNQRSFGMYMNIDGKPRFLWSSDGAAGTALDKSCTAATGFVDGAFGYLAATLDVDNGAGGNDLKFWTSADGSSWAQLGSTVTTAGTTSIFNGTAIVEIGSYLTGTGLLLNGKPSEVELYNGIPPMLGGSGSATPVIDFNPNRDATTPTGTITSSTTGEVWTINGASSVVRNAAYHGSMVDGVKCYDTDRSGNPISTSGSYPIVGYVPWEARTNLDLQSNALTTTWADVGTTAATQNATGPNGQANYAWTLTDNNVGAVEYKYQDRVLTAATYTTQWKIKKTIGAQASYPVLVAIAQDGSLRAALCTVDTTNGIATVWTAYTGLTIQTSSARCRSHSVDFWLVELTFVATAATWRNQILPAGTTNATQATGISDVTAVGAVIACDSQTELGSFATPYQPTTTVAVARNANLLTYTGADVANIKTLACTFSRGVGIATAGTVAALSDNTANEYSSISLTSATAVRFDGVDGGVSKWQTTASNAYTPAATSKAAYSAATNSIKMDLDGTAQTEDTVATLPTVTQVQVGHLNGAVFLNGPVNHIYGWIRNLSQSELGAIDA